MALIPCPECGAKVSDKAVACPGCGNSINPQGGLGVRKWPWWFGFEWKTKTKIFGLPLVHIAFGIKIDENGFRFLAAKGIIAIGQFGAGVITIAQFGVGIITLAQFGLGLLFGLGQFILGIVAVGQFAAGVVAYGFRCIGLL